METTLQKWDLDCAIIGGGPGGLVAALYLRRFRRNVALFNEGKSRAAWIPETHNLLGFDRGISGKVLLRRLHRQVSSLGMEWVKGQAKVRRRGEGFEVSLRPDQEAVTARTVILATGIEDVQPPLDNVVELRELGLLRYCSICDGYDFRDQHLGVFIHDSAGIEKALFLRNWSRQLTLFVPVRMKLRETTLAQFRELRIRVVRHERLRAEFGRFPRGLSVYPDDAKPVFVRAAYVELGCAVRDFAFRGLPGLKTTDDGFLIATTEQRLSVPGLFAVGDCVNQVGQISIAAGQAAVAATTIHNDLL